MFAQATPPDSTHLLQLVLIVSLFATIASAIATVVNVVSNRKQRREVNFAFEPASKVEFDKHSEENKRAHEHLYTVISSKERGLREEAAWNTDKLHDKVNAVANDVSGLKQSNELQNQLMAAANSDIKKILERLPRHS